MNKHSGTITLLLLLILALYAGGCHKHTDNPQPAPPDPGPPVDTGTHSSDTLPFAVYLGGYIYEQNGDQVGAYWINDSIVKMPEIGIVTSIQTSGKNIYLSCYGHSEDLPFYYKNGRQVRIPNARIIGDICVVGDDVYATGVDSSYINRYWKNDTMYTLEGLDGHQGYATHDKIYVIGADVYVTGSLHSTGAIWKNGKVTLYPSTGGIASMAIIGNDLYAGGFMYISSVCYFKNGQQIDIDPTGLSAGNYIIPTPEGIAVVCENGNGASFLYQDGQAYPLDIEGLSTYTASSDNSYIAGTSYKTGKVMLWKNGIITEKPYSGRIFCVYAH